MLWIIDVDGVPLLIDASLGEAGTSAQDRAAHIQIAESVRIEPR
jgi:tetrahydromethanopterin S-methyltransferase subunit H